MTNQEEYLAFFRDKAERAAYELIPGQGVVMISAPHSVEQTRNGNLKFGEYETGVLAKLLHDDLGCPVIYKTCNLGDDANYDEVCAYKSALKQYVDEEYIDYVIDLHELHPGRENNFDLGTGNGDNIAADPVILDIVRSELLERDFDKVVVDDIFNARYPYTVSSYIARECQISCLQVEINSKLLCSGFEEYRFDDVYAALRGAVLRLNA